MNEEDLIKEHINWLNGELPSQKNTHEKDFSEAPIYHFYNDRKDPLAKLWSLDLNQSPAKRKVLLDELERLLKFVKGS